MRIAEGIELPDIPEITTLRQFEACAKRIVASLPEKNQPRYTITLEGGAFAMEGPREGKPVGHRGRTRAAGARRAGVLA